MGIGVIPLLRLPFIDYFTSKTKPVVPPSKKSAPPPPPPPPPVSTPKGDVMALANKHSKGKYYWPKKPQAPTSGSPVEIRFKGAEDAFGKDKKGNPIKPKIWEYKNGEWVWPKTPEGTYCTGFTFGIAMQAAQERGLLDGKSPKEISAMQQMWNGATPESKEKQIAYVMEKTGIGTEIKKKDDAKAGDFVQIWRSTPKDANGKADPNGTIGGHSVIFLNWVTKPPNDPNGEKIGINYRSTQPKTEGIGDRIEYFKGSKGGDVNPDRIYIGRLNGG